MYKPIHLLVKEDDIAPNVVAVGDPGRVRLLSALLMNTRVVNENRGLLTITGRYKGVNVTLATHGIGAPSAAIVFEELKMVGAKRIVRLGTCGSVSRVVKPGSVVVALSSIYDEGGCGLKQYYKGLSAPTAPDPYLTVRIMDELDRSGLEYRPGVVYCSDSFYGEENITDKLVDLNVACVDMETALLYGLSWLRGFEALSVLIVSNDIARKDRYLGADELKHKILKTANVIIEVFSKYYGKG